MVVRIQGVGQFRVDAETERGLDQLDDQIVAAVGQQDLDTAHTLLQRAIDMVRKGGTPLDVSDLAPSDLILPAADASLDEINSLVHAS